MIKFIEHSSSKYPPRTFENASADATIAFAFDFNTAGEKLTRDAAITQGKMYIPVQPPFSDDDVNRTVHMLSKVNASTLNIAGNGLYTTIQHNYSQTQCDDIVFNFLSRVVNRYENNITLIRSGGQSGFDEAGLKAAVKLGIPALCVLPKGWRFADIDRNDICDEKRFKERFNGALIL